MPDINQIFGGATLKAADLQGRDWTLTIMSVELKNFNDGNKLVIHFQNAQKPFICNKTNAQRIGLMYGPDTNLWPGNRVTLFQDFTMYQGQQTPCIRVRPPVQQQPVSQARADAMAMPPVTPRVTSHAVLQAAMAQSENPGAGLDDTQPPF